MSEDNSNTPEACWRRLCTEGRLKPVDVASNDLEDHGRPKWLDAERFAKAREAILKYYLGVSYSSLTGLLLILQLPDGLEPLLSTGNSKDIPSLYRRYLATVLHVQSWYDDCVFDPETKGYKSIRQVRAMHRRMQTAMNEKFKTTDVEGQPRKWFTQYDVATTQFAFIGLGMLYPQKCGMIAASSEELELINYYWRVLGHLMGIEDEFNLCQFDKYEDIQAYFKLIFQSEFLDNFAKHPCEKGLSMTQSVCLALHYFLPLLTFNLLANWWADVFHFNGYEPQPMSTKEKILHFWTRLAFNTMHKNEKILRFSTKLHRKRFEARLKNKEQHYQKLKEKYKDAKHLVYTSDRYTYFDKSAPAVEHDESGVVRSANGTSKCPFGFVDSAPKVAAFVGEQQVVCA